MSILPAPSHQCIAQSTRIRWFQIIPSSGMQMRHVQNVSRHLTGQPLLVPAVRSHGDGNGNDACEEYRAQTDVFHTRVQSTMLCQTISTKMTRMMNENKNFRVFLFFVVRGSGVYSVTVTVFCGRHRAWQKHNPTVVDPQRVDGHHSWSTHHPRTVRNGWQPVLGCPPLQNRWRLGHTM